jgi:hypothetical protein
MKKTLAALLIYFGLASAALAQAALVTQIPTSGNTANVTASTTFTSAAAAATLTGVSGKWTYICGFVVSSAATTSATLGNITVTGTVSGTLNFEYSFVSTGQGIFGIAFGPGCIQSSAENTSIVVNTPAGGAGTVGAVTAWGFTN